MTQKPTVLFLGTPEFALTSLKLLFEAGFPIVGVVAQPDKPSGRGQKMHAPPVAEFAKANNLKLFQPPKIRDDVVLAELESLKPDFVIVAAYGKILPERLLKIAKIECLNVHGSLLPDYRGAAPINQALLDDKKITGVSIMRVVKELDAGDVFLTKEVPISDTDDAVSLTNSLADIGAHALIETMNKITQGELKAKPQDAARASYAHKLTKEMAALDFNKPARAIFNQVRALVPWPVAQTKLEGKTLKIYRTEILNTKSGKTPGQVTHIAQAGITVATADFDLLIKEAQLEGKKRMNAFDLANGCRLRVGNRFA